MFAHIDADAFFASVLRRRQPKLHGVPLLALGMGGGCVIAASYEAKAKGVKVGMRISEAKKLAPDAVAADTDFTEAHHASQEIESILRDACIRTEKASIDEWYADLRTCEEESVRNPEVWALKMQHDIHVRTAIPVSIGIAPSKLLAKMASPHKKPFGVFLIRDENEAQTFLKSVPPEAIPGIGRGRTVHVRSRGWANAWDIASASEDLIVHLFGRPGKEMQSELRGIPVHDVVTESGPPKSVSRCRSFRKTRDHEFVLSILVTHLSYLILRMRREGLGCTFLFLWLRDDTYKRHGLDIKLPQMMTTEEELMPYARTLWAKLRHIVPCCTQAGLGLTGLKGAGTSQYSLFTDAQNTDRGEGLQQTMDTLRTQFGRDVLRRGAALKLPKKKKLLLTEEDF